MELDWGTAAFGIVFMLLCALPFALDYRSRMRKTKRLVQPLLKAAQQQGCQVHQHETCNLVILGLDERKNILFSFNALDDGATVQRIDLSRVRSCRTENGSNGSALTHRVELLFQMKEKGMTDLRLELYREGANLPLNGELQFADKWSRLINDRLKG
ncbi:MAG: hypothetical protein IPF41_15080 [Flavobacteriales bacterium]|nr:hypothetical protein [Flavobacteriales bacterium]